MDVHPNSDIPEEEALSPPTPIIYENEEYHWQYKHVRQDLDKEEPLNEERLNELGKEGWELVTVFNQANKTAHYYFKRPADETG